LGCWGGKGGEKKKVASAMRNTGKRKGVVSKLVEGEGEGHIAGWVVK